MKETFAACYKHQNAERAAFFLVYAKIGAINSAMETVKKITLK